MLRDLKDAWGWIQQIVRRIERLESGAQLGNSSITKGRMRFIGGTLRVDSGGRVEIVGYLQVEGTTSITGPVTISGNLDVTGNSTFTGPLSIEGATSITGQLTVAGPSTFTGTLSIKGTTTIEGDTTVEGELTVDGPWEMNGNGTISGDVTVDGDFKIIAPGKFSIGNSITIDPAHNPGGQIKFDNTAEIYGGGTGDNAQLQLIVPGDPGASILLQPDGIRIPYGLEQSTGGKYLGIDDFGKLIIKLGGTGGPGGPGDGIFKWPFPLDQVTSEFRSAERPNHDGIDFGIGASNTAGTPIPSMGAGVVKTILAEGQGHGWGNGVIIDHGTDPLYGGALVETLYAHMSTPPVVALGAAVALGETLGPIGNTGNSFGNHLHLEVHVNGSPVNPREFMAAHGG